MRERDEPAPRQRFRQQQGDGPVMEDAAGQGHGTDAAAPRSGKRQIGKPFRQPEMEPAGQIGDRNACPPQFQQVQKKGCGVKFQKAAAFLDGKRRNGCYRYVLMRFQPDGRLPFIGDGRAQSEQRGNGVEQAAAA